MGSRYEVEVTVESARDLKNVNWRNGDLQPYVVLWINDDGPKCSTRVDLDGGENPDWDNEKVVVPLPPSATRLEDAVLYVDVVHANAAEGVKPLVGSARLPLRDFLDETGGGIGGKVSRTLRLKRPSGRPQGRLDVRVAVRESARYYDPTASASPYPAPPYAGSRDAFYGQPGPYAAPPSGYPAAAAAAGAGYGYGYGGPQQAYGYGAPPPPPPPPVTTAEYSTAPSEKSSGGKMGMGTGLAVGAAAGVLGGLALAGGASYLEDKFEDNVAEKAEDELAARDDEDY